MINGLKIVLSHLTVIKMIHSYIVMVIRTALNSLIVGNTKSIIVSVGRYLIIKKILFVFRKKFATTNNKRRYGDYKKIKKYP